MNVRLKSELIFGSVFNTFSPNPNRISQKGTVSAFISLVSPNLCCVRAKDKHKSLCKFADNSFRPPQIFVEYEQKTKNGVYVNLQIIFHFQASPNLRRVLPHGEQRGPRQGPKMVVKHPRGQHAHGLAPVRGQSPLGFLHDLPVYCFFF